MLLGKNVKVRPLEKTDLDLFYEWMGSQESVGSYMDAQLINKDSFLDSMEALLKDKRKLYTIIEDNNGKSIGIMNYREMPGSSSTLEVGILIAESSLRGKGLGSECLKLFVNYIFNTKNVMRIQFLTRVENSGMKIVGEKAGFMMEGILRKYKLEHGAYRDFYILAITRDEWKGR